MWRRPMISPSAVSAVISSAAGRGGTLDEERVVARGGEALRHAAKHVGILVEDGRSFAVHEAAGADDMAAEIVADGLVAEADAEEGFFARKGADDVERHAGLGGRARAG